MCGGENDIKTIWSIPVCISGGKRMSKKTKNKDKNIPAIVSEELWNRANQILELRSNVVKNKELSIRNTKRK